MGDHSAARLHIFARPAWILRRNNCTRCQQEYEEPDKNLYAFHGTLFSLSVVLRGRPRADLHPHQTPDQDGEIELTGQNLSGRSERAIGVCRQDVTEPVVVWSEPPG